MAKKKRSADVEPAQLEVADGRKALDALASALAALRPDELEAPRVDVQVSAATAYSIGVRDTAPERRARFAKLADAGFFSIGALDQLCLLALATWYARGEQARAMGLRTDVKVPEPVLSGATEVRTRMLRLLGYYFEDDAELGPVIRLIRSGLGYQDTANDLLALADLYERDTVLPVIENDTKHYRDTDVASARKSAQAIFLALGLKENDESKRWTMTVQRAWTLLSRAYEQVRAAAGLLFQDEEVARSYPSLIAAARIPGGKRAPEPEPPAPPAPSANAQG